MTPIRSNNSYLFIGGLRGEGDDNPPQTLDNPLEKLYQNNFGFTGVSPHKTRHSHFAIGLFATGFFATGFFATCHWDFSPQTKKLVANSPI